MYVPTAIETLAQAQVDIVFQGNVRSTLKLYPAIFVSLAAGILVLSCTVRKFLTSCQEFSWPLRVIISQGKLFKISTVKDTFRWCSPPYVRNYRSTSGHSPFLHSIKLPPSISSLYYFFFAVIFRLPCDHLSVFSWLYTSIGMLGDLPVSPTNTQTLRHTWKNWELY